jgi:shikimate kinase
MGGKKLGDTMDNIYLIGFMGSGKTTIGKALGNYLNISVIDTDEEIIRIKNKSITDIFNDEGEPAFRRYENEVLRNLPSKDCIVTTGGGIIKSEENRLWLKENGLVVFLDATPDEIVNRLMDDQSRPLLIGDKKAKISQMLEERMALYSETANFIVDTTGKQVNVIVEEIVKRLNL